LFIVSLIVVLNLLIIGNIEDYILHATPLTIFDNNRAQAQVQACEGVRRRGTLRDVNRVFSYFVC